MPNVAECVEKAADYEKRAVAEADANLKQRLMEIARYYRLLSFDVMEAEAAAQLS
jgi:hypothetical protein